VANALAKRDANRSRNGDDSLDLGTGVRRQAPVARECTYSDFLKCQPLNFKGAEGVELALMCDRMFPEESDEIENTLAERQAENKRKLDNNNQAQQQPPKKQGVAITYTAGSSERKEYVGTLPLCNKCKLYHNGQCTIKCANYKRVGHLTRDCRSPAATNNQRNLTCYECENQGHYRSDCPKINNQNHGNQTGGTGARGMVHTLGRGGEINQDPNNMENDINS
ncbi:hypothetical protein Tco_1442417, partial [Tanacetum coccineum]